MSFRAITILAAVMVGSTGARGQQTVIVGRVADDSTGAPLRGARVSVAPAAGTLSDSAGRYSLTVNGPGEYTITASLAGYPTLERRVTRTRAVGVDTIVADFRLKRAQQLNPVRTQAPRRQRPPIQDVASSSGTGTNDQALSLTIDPTTKGDLVLGALAVPGISLVPDPNGGPPTFSVFGLAPSQNLLTLNGLMYGGAIVPSTAYVSTRVATTASDPTVGGFSGGLIATSLSTGGRYYQANGAIQLDNPALQVTDAAGRALGQRYNNVQASVGSSGPLWRDRVFYNGALQVAQRNSDAISLVTADSSALARAGTSPAGVASFVDALNSVHVPISQSARDGIVTRSGALLGRVDLFPTATRIVDVTANANWRRATPTLLSAVAAPSRGGTITTSTSGVTGEYAHFIQDFYLTRLRFGATATVNDASPLARLPEGRVLTTQAAGGPNPGFATLLFGGSSTLSQRTTAITLESTWETSWFVPSNTHRPKVAAGLRGDVYENSRAQNTLGAFSYNSVSDLTAGKPSAFTRTLSGGDWRASEVYPWIGATDLWRVTDRVSFQYGARVENNLFLTQPDENPAIASAFGVRTDRVPQTAAILPRLGFNWQYGHNKAKAALGPSGAPTGFVRATLGAYRSALPVTALGAALAGTGLPSSLRRITCVGPSTPTPNWSAYEASESNIPTACADSASGTSFADTRPTATLFMPGFNPPTAWRATLGLSRAFVFLTRIAVDGMYSLSPNQQATRDLNFAGVQRATLPAEENRPLFADPTRIDPRTGAIDPLAPRANAAFSRVAGLASDGRSETKQITVLLTPGATLSVSSYFSLSYTYTRSRDLAGGFDATTFGDPRTRTWTTGAGDIRHSINAYATWTIGDESFFTLTSQLRSGAPFTPVVQGDVNGDGYANDRAFIYDAAGTTDTSLSHGMSSLLRAAPSNVRDCLAAQTGHAAARNSCRGPWTMAVWAGASTALSELHLPTRARINFTFSNPLALVDQLLHGESMHGWGQPALPNATLMAVTGFDQATRSFRYAVNPLFGDTRPARSAVRAPFVLTIQITSPLGPPQQRQILDEVLRPGRSKAGAKLTPDQIKARYSASGFFDPVPPIMAARDSLLLTREQSAQLVSINRAYGLATDSVWTALAAELASTPQQYDAEAMMERVKVARGRAFDALERAAAAIRAILAPEQFRLMAPELQQLLDERALRRLRHLQGV